MFSLTLFWQRQHLSSEATMITIESCNIDGLGYSSILPQYCNNKVTWLTHTARTSAMWTLKLCQKIKLFVTKLELHVTVLTFKILLGKRHAFQNNNPQILTLYEKYTTLINVPSLPSQNCVLPNESVLMMVKSL